MGLNSLLEVLHQKNSTTTSSSFTLSFPLRHFFCHVSYLLQKHVFYQLFCLLFLHLNFSTAKKYIDSFLQVEFKLATYGVWSFLDSTSICGSFFHKFAWYVWITTSSKIHLYLFNLTKFESIFNKIYWYSIKILKD